MAPPGTKALLVSENSATTNLPFEHVASGNSTASRMTVPAADMPVSDTHPRGRPPRCFPSAPTPSVGHVGDVAALASGPGQTPLDQASSSTRAAIDPAGAAAPDPALLRLIGRRHADAEPLAQGSDGQREFVERDRHPLVHWLLAREVVVPTSQVLHEAMPNDDHPGAAVLLEPAHRPQPRLEAAVVALDPVVGVAVGAVPRRWQQLLQHGRVHRRLIGGDLDGRDFGRADGPLEEPAGCRWVPIWGYEHINDLAELVDRPVDIPPAAGHLHIGLLDSPAVTDGMAAGPRGVGQQRREPLHPPVDGDVVDLDAALGEQLLHVAVRQRQAQIPPHGQHDHVWREAEPNERRPRDRSGAKAASSHGDSLPTLGSITAGATVPWHPHGQSHRPERTVWIAGSARAMGTASGLGVSRPGWAVSSRGRLTCAAATPSRWGRWPARSASPTTTAGHRP